MAIHASWPTADEPEVTITYGTSDRSDEVREGNEEFDRFENLTRRLVGVSKGELVEKRDDES